MSSEAYSAIAQRTRELYRAGALRKAQVDAMYRAKKLTRAEYDWILSPDDGEA